MLSVTQFLQSVDRNAARVTEYKSGGDGSGGGCDCIGLIIGAIRLTGEKWPWTHGSNYTARYLLAEPIAADRALQLGDLVFKARAPGAAGYSLPDRYRGGSDLNDYYHVGVVTQDAPLRITHCTGVPGGVKIDTVRGQWKYSGRLKLIEAAEAAGADQKGAKAMNATIISPNGGKVNLRQSAAVTAALVAQLAPDTAVEVLGTTSSGWTHVRSGARSGYVMSQYLSCGDAETAKAAQLAQAISLLEQAIAMLNTVE